jgi:hypothetical protein
MRDRTFNLTFDPQSFAELDAFATLAARDTNYGDKTHWELEYRGGHTGLYYRMKAVVRHYYELHAWLPIARHPVDVEYHLSSILFGMDSAIECCTFMLSALGHGVAPTKFRDVSDSRSVAQIRPRDILGDLRRTPPIAPQAGFREFFPSVVELWQAKAALIALIMDNHDVSKHRQAVFRGGQYRNDAPPGFFAAAGADDDAVLRLFYTPIAETILFRDPKVPSNERTPTPLEDVVYLEDIVPEFTAFLISTGTRALADARLRIAIADAKPR